MKYNEYKNKYFIDKNEDGNKKVLEKLYKNYDINKVNLKEVFNNANYNTKKNKIILKINDIIVCIKLTSLYIKFYDKKTKNMNTKIKFPFELLSVFYGINFIDFKKFLVSIIHYNNNHFEIKFDEMKNKYGVFTSYFYFYELKSYFEEYNNKNDREFFEIDWNYKDEKQSKYFKMKIILPQMSISLKYNNQKVKFYSSVDIKTMGYLLDSNFKDWDFIILNYFSQYKLFRYEINKLLNDKQNSLGVNFEENKNNDNKIKFNKKLISNSNIKLFNLNQIHTILNTKNKNSSIYDF